MPAARFFVALALIAAVLVGAVAAPALAWMALGADALLLAAFAIDWRRAARTRLEADRRWPPLLVQGVAAPVEVRVRAPDRRTTVVAREALHPSLAESPRRRRFEVPAGAAAVWRYELRCRRRGEPWAGPLTVRVLGPWGLAWSQRDLLPPRRCRVYPQVRWEGDVGRLLALAHRRELGQAPLRAHGLGSEPYALREYLPGDPLTKVHWKATARHGRPISREETWERGARLVLLLDCGRAMASLDGGRSKLDHALAAALALTRVAASRGDRVTLIAFSDRVERVVRVKGGARGVAAAYARLFDLEARLAEPAYDLAAQAVSERETRRAMVVVLTSVVDLAAADILRESLMALRRHHRPVLVNLEDPDLGALARGAPASASQAFAKVAGIEILLANRRLGRRLRHAGIRVASTSADRLAWEALAAYLGPAMPSARRKPA